MRQVDRIPLMQRPALGISGPSVGSPDPVARYVAADLGMTPRDVEQLIRGRAAVNLRCAALIDAFHALGKDERLIRFLQPIDLAIANARPAGVSDARLTYDDIDTLHAMARTGDAAETFVHHADQALARLLEVRNAVASRHGLRPAHPLKIA